MLTSCELSQSWLGQIGCEPEKTVKAMSLSRLCETGCEPLQLGQSWLGHIGCEPKKTVKAVSMSRLCEMAVATAVRY